MPCKYQTQLRYTGGKNWYDYCKFDHQVYRPIIVNIDCKGCTYKKDVSKVNRLVVNE